MKGLYKLARIGEIKNFTGISSPYETPEKAELTVNTDTQTLKKSVEKIMQMLIERGIINGAN